MAIVSGPNTKDASGNSVSRLIRVFRRDTGALVGDTVSKSSDGSWSLTIPGSVPSGTNFFAVCHDSTGLPGLAQYMVLGIPFEGTNGSTSIVDVTGKTITNNNVTISTAQYPSISGATSSGLFNSTSDYLTVPKTTAFQFSGDFTVRCRLYRTSTPTSQGAIFSTTKTAGSDYYSLRSAIGPTNLPYISLSTNGTSTALTVTGSSATPLNTWFDYEAVRYGSTVDLRINGSLVGTGSLSGAIYYQTADPVCIGTDPANGGVGYDNKWPGYMRDMIVLNGLAMHKADFIVPSASFIKNLMTAAENALIYDDLTAV